MKNFSLAIILASSLAFPQQIDSLKLTELESLKLKNAQYQAIIAQQNVDLLQLQLEKAQIQARDTYSTLNSQAEEIKNRNKSKNRRENRENNSTNSNKRKYNSKSK